MKGHSHDNTLLFFISDKVSDIDSEEGVSDEKIAPDLNSTQESETAVPTKTEETKTGRFFMTLFLGSKKKKGGKWLDGY